MNYFSILDEDGQFKGALRTVLSFEEIAQIAGWRIISYSANGRKRKAIFNGDGCVVIHHLVDPTRGRGEWRGMGDHPTIEFLA